MRNPGNINLLVIEDEEFDVKRIANTLKPFSDKIRIAEVVSSGKAAVEMLKTGSGRFDVVIMDYQISGGLFGEKLIAAIRAIDPTLQIIIITKMTINQTDIRFANQLIESGAYWFGTKYPGDIEDYIYQPTDFVLSILNAWEKRELERAHERSRSKLDRSIEALITASPMIGESDSVKALRARIDKYAATNANVLILGESGTGKEMVASNLHYQSKRRYENFITVNCAAIPRELIESELFGFTKGSFTGAGEDRTGYFEQADGGTIFLDEVTDLPMAAQAKLLRVLQEGEIDKIGRRQKHRVDVRVLAATNKDIEDLLNRKEFREDLYYRLNILQIKVPPLRERHGDLALLLEYFIQHYSRDAGLPAPQLHKDALKALEQYHWPGNVRQLRNVVHRLVILAGDTITVDLVNDCIGMDRRGGRPALDTSFFNQSELLPLRDMEQQFRSHYVSYVRRNSKTDSEAARRLGLAPSNFYRLCKELGLK